MCFFSCLFTTCLFFLCVWLADIDSFLWTKHSSISLQEASSVEENEPVEGMCNIEKIHEPFHVDDDNNMLKNSLLSHLEFVFWQRQQQNSQRLLFGPAKRFGGRQERSSGNVRTGMYAR